jgi:hypothetical protein
MPMLAEGDNDTRRLASRCSGKSIVRRPEHGGSMVDVGHERAALDPLGRMVYETLYRLTARTRCRKLRPKGRRSDQPRTCPLSWPTMFLATVSCRAAFGGSGADVMRCHSDFDKTRFEDLWTDIARRL